MLNIKERQAGDTTVLDLEGNIIMGGGSTHLRETIRRLIEEDKKKLILNFASVKYLDSSGVGELVSGSVALGRVGGQLKLMNLPAKVEQVMALSSLLSIFEVCDDETNAPATPPREA